jgi:hypothetical protein
VYGLLETLMNEAREYVRVAPVAEWLMETLPPDRLKPEVLKYWGGCSEYIMRDYTKAAQAYAVLRDRFMDAVSVEDMNSAIARVKQKAEGKFPKEPAENAAGPEGAFARFLKAARTRDSKAVKALVAKDVVEDFVERLGDSSEELLPSLVFADFIVRKTDLNADGNAAKLTIEHYDASSGKPKPLTEAAVQEDGQWKIRWEDPAEDDAPPGLQVQPAAEQKKDAAPAAKTDAKK